MLRRVAVLADQDPEAMEALLGNEGLMTALRTILSRMREENGPEAREKDLGTG